jgi:NADPH-dependent curcumin reductase CurA
MEGSMTGVVVESKAPDFKPGDRITGFGTWQEYVVFKASAVRKVLRTKYINK